MSQSQEATRGKFQRDVVWNFASLAVLGVSGIALNVLISRYYDADTLGVFNQALAAYIFFSQAAAAGINLSVLRAVAEHAHDRARVTSIVAGGILPAVALAAIATLAYYFSRHAIAAWLESDGVAVGIAASTPGLFFFAINKLLLGVVNGVQRMRAYAVYQATRYLLILCGLFLAVYLKLEGAKLAFVFSFAESILFLVLAVEVWRQLAWPVLPDWRPWVRKHFDYGIKSAGSGILLELNARVDVLMIGYFLSDAQVGIYTFAAMLAEGVYQLLVVLQNLYNPILAKDIAARELDRLLAMIKKGRRWTYALMLVVGVVAVLVYPIALGILTDKPEFASSASPFRWLMLGLVLAAGYIPFGQTLLMAGHPAWHTGLMVATVLTNVIGNSILIPILGIDGAAIATSISMLASVFLLKALVRRKVGLQL